MSDASGDGTLRRALPFLLAVTAVVVGILVTVLVTALTASSSLRVPTNADLQYSARGDHTGISGELGAKSLGDRVCFWIVTGDGRRVTLVFPTGWSATKGRALRDEGGSVVATPGQRVEFDRSTAAQQQPAGCPTEQVVGVLHLESAG